MAIINWLEGLSLSGGAGILIPSSLFALSVALFGFIIFNLHRSMSVRNALGIDLSGLRKSGRPLFIFLYGVAYVALYGLVFPLLAYVWFCVLVTLLAFLHNTKGPEDLLLIGMAVLTSVRVTAYYNEDLSKDIAKILPYGLLGIFLVNLGQFDYERSVGLLERTVSEEDTAFYYWVYISGQELVLRVTQPSVIWLYHSGKAWVSERVMRMVRRMRHGRAVEAPGESSGADGLVCSSTSDEGE